jgi:DNA-binding beta-propeller fold protein YncE
MSSTFIDVARAAARRSAVGGVVGFLAVGLAGCGTSGTGAGHVVGLPAAEPGHDATLGAPPAGRSVPVGADPQGIVVQADGQLVAVGTHTAAGRDPSSLVVLSARTGRVVKRIGLAGAPRHLAIAGPRGPVLVPEERVDRLVEVSLPSGRTRAFGTGDFPHAAAAGGGRVFVGNERGGTLTEIFPSGRVRTIAGFTQPGGLAAVDGDMAVVDVATFTLTLLDIDTAAVIGRLPAGRGPTHDAAADGRIYVLDTRGDAVLTYSAHPFRRIGRLGLAGSPYGVALDPVRRRLWVTETATNRVAELSLSGRLPRLIRSYPTGVQPDTVAVDTQTGRVFLANQVAGTVQIIDPVN